MKRFEHAIGRAITVLLLMFFWSASASAQTDEIQVYDAETAPVGETGFEFDFNYSAAGVKTGEGAEHATDQVSRYTLEPHVGITDWCEAGAYLQTALLPSGDFEYAGVKLRR